VDAASAARSLAPLSGRGKRSKRPRTAAEAGLLGSLPIHFARPAARLLDLDLYLPPYDPPILDVVLFWHRRVDGNAANAWLRHHIKRVLDFGPVEVTVPLVP
jgi:hypothetical protein